MDEVIDFDEWFVKASAEPIDVVYAAVFDTDTGQVMKVGPDAAFSEPNKIIIPQETAIDIMESRVKMSNCFVDTDSETLEITETENLFKIDDVLHRVIESMWTDIENPDISLTFNKIDSILTIELSEEYGGTRKNSSARKRNMFWSGDTVLNFLITDYNDPHVIYDVVHVTIDELKGKKFNILIKDDFNRFSVYTRRVFKKYVIEYA